MVQSFIGPGGVASINNAILRGLATAMALQPLEIVLMRLDEDTDEDVAVGPPVAVAMTISNKEPLDSLDDAFKRTSIEGYFRAFAPWDVRIGDSGTLPGGQPFTVYMVPPAKNGVQRADFRIYEGAI